MGLAPQPLLVAVELGLAHHGRVGRECDAARHHLRHHRKAALLAERHRLALRLHQAADVVGRHAVRSDAKAWLTLAYVVEGRHLRLELAHGSLPEMVNRVKSDEIEIRINCFENGRLK